MSAPGIYTRQAENLEYGFLAAKALEAIEAKRSGADLDQIDLDTLQTAREFLLKVVEGASLVTGAKFHGHAAQVVAALRFAASPITSLQEVISNDEEFSTYFRELADALVSSDVDVQGLASAESFFSFMLESLRDSLSGERSRFVGPEEDRRDVHRKVG